MPRTVIVLSLVSLLNDAASEMITPLLPVFLTAALGAGPAVVGLVEGLAEAASSALKLVSGRLADRGWSIRGLVLGGYGLSNMARPLMAVALSWPWVMGLRFTDRVGKGLRTSPRDALIAASVPAERRGRAFGFHRGMDHAGAAVGPLAAFALLHQGMPMTGVFAWSVVPGAALLVLLALGLPAQQPVPGQPPPRLRWGALHAHLRALVLAAGALALATIPEALLILWAFQGGVETAWIPLLWAAVHVVKGAAAFPGGVLSDRLGRLPVVLAGWVVRSAVLVAMAFCPDGWGAMWGLFLAYGAGLALTEGAERALIGDCAAEGERATAFGLYHLVVSLLALPGGLLFGLLWEGWSSAVALLTAAGLTAACTGALAWLARRARQG